MALIVKKVMLLEQKRAEVAELEREIAVLLNLKPAGRPKTIGILDLGDGPEQEPEEGGKTLGRLRPGRTIRTPAMVEEVFSKLKAGISQRDIARELNVSNSFIFNIVSDLRKAGRLNPPAPNNGETPPEKIAEVLKQRKAGRTLAEIEKLTGVSQSTISKAIRQARADGQAAGLDKKRGPIPRDEDKDKDSARDAEIIRRRTDGESMGEISDKMKISKATIHRVLKTAALNKEKK